MCECIVLVMYIIQFFYCSSKFGSIVFWLPVRVVLMKTAPCII
jgi:hypothetical protein